MSATAHAPHLPTPRRPALWGDVGHGGAVATHARAPHAMIPPAAARVSPPDPRTDERQLVARALGGDAHAERALYDAHVARVYRLAYRLAGDDDLARDITQDTFVRAFERLAAFRHESAFATWLHRIGLSVALNTLEKVERIRRREGPLEEGLTRAAPERRADPDLRARMVDAIDALPPGYRAVFVMHDVEGYTHEEIGAALGVQPGTSKAQLFHARARLRTQLAPFRREDVR